MNRHPASWLHQLLGAAIMLAVSVWLINWTVNTIRPLIPFLMVVAIVAGALWFAARIVKRRRYW